MAPTPSEPRGNAPVPLIAYEPDSRPAWLRVTMGIGYVLGLVGLIVVLRLFT